MLRSKPTCCYTGRWGLTLPTPRNEYQSQLSVWSTCGLRSQSWGGGRTEKNSLALKSRGGQAWRKGRGALWSRNKYPSREWGGVQDWSCTFPFLAISKCVLGKYVQSWYRQSVPAFKSVNYSINSEDCRADLESHIRLLICTHLSLMPYLWSQLCISVIGYPR